MVLTEVFVKILTKTDINNRLSFPTKHLDVLPFEGENREAEFQVSPCEDEGSVWIFCCIKRKNDDYPKPTIARGWSQVVRDKELQVEDRLTFYIDHEEGGPPPRFRIKVERPGIMFFGVFHPQPMGNYWHRIV